MTARGHAGFSLVRILVLLAMAAGILVGLTSFLARRHARNLLYERLVAAGSVAGLRTTCADMQGTFLDLGGGPWIAIAYVDEHSPPALSLSMALDSRGRFYENWHHYCGSYGFFNSRRAVAAGADQTLEAEEARKSIPADPFFQAEQAGTLDSAIGILEREGFRRVYGWSPPPFLKP